MLEVLKRMFSRNITRAASGTWTAIRAGIALGNRERGADVSYQITFSGTLGTDTALAFPGGASAEIKRRVERDWQASSERATLARLVAIRDEHEANTEALSELSVAKARLAQLIADPTVTSGAVLSANQEVADLESIVTNHQASDTFDAALRDAEAAAGKFLQASASEHRQAVSDELAQRREAALAALSTARVNKLLDELFACGDEQRRLAEGAPVGPRDLNSIMKGES